MRNHRHAAVAVLAFVIGASGCQKGTPNNSAAGSGSAGSATVRAGSAAGSAGSGSAAPAVPPQDIDSKDILARTETSPDVFVKHVLITWKDLNPARAAHGASPLERSNADAAKLAQDIAAKLKANPDQIDALMKESSEDKASIGGDPYEVKSDSPLVPEFKNMALRLKDKEVGIVKSRFGYHVMLRVAKPLPDPMESADILAREPPAAEPVRIQMIQIGWKDLPNSKAASADKRGAERTKEDADKLVTEVLAKVRAGGDMKKLMKEYSEDPSTATTGRIIDLQGPVPRGFDSLKALSLRLKINEAGIAKTIVGYFVIKRAAAEPPDPLESHDIMKREIQSQKVKVKHILLGWTEVHADDERGKKRTRPELDKLVKATVAKLKKGEKIEPLMAELSEDPGSAKTGMSYDVSPDAGLVQGFKDLSLRLKLNEVGVVKTNFGLHIIQRVE
jgi:parvulin-like peptidyl-prolyl isomerase